MAMDSASVPELAGIQFPFYVRKLDKKGSWGHGDDNIESRKSLVPRAIFDADKLRFSLYEVREPADLKLVTVALNAWRNRLNNQVDYVAFSGHDLDTAGLNILGDVSGETMCLQANSLHVDVEATEFTSFEMLCSNAIDSGRNAFRVTKGEVKKILKEVEASGCFVFPGNSEGTCSCGHQP